MLWLGFFFPQVMQILRLGWLPLGICTHLFGHCLRRRWKRSWVLWGEGPVFFCFAATQLSLSLFNTKICAKAWILSGWGVLGWWLSFIFVKCSLYTASVFKCLGLAKGLVQSRAKSVARAILPWCPWESSPMDVFILNWKCRLFPSFLFLAH